MKRLLDCFLLVLLLMVSLPSGVHGADIPLDVRRQVLAAQQLMDEKLYDQALTALGENKSDQDHYLIDFTRGNIYLLSERPQQALLWLQQVVDKAPDYLPGWLNLAQTQYALELYVAAGTSFERAFTLSDPPRRSLRYNAALCFMQSGEWERAKHLLRQLVALDPQQVELPWRAALVQVYLNLDQPQQALSQLMILVQQTQGAEQRRWREVLVQQYLTLERYDDAISALNRYTEVDGLYPRWWTVLTYAYLERQQYRQALVSLKVVDYLRPLSEQEAQLLGDLHLQLGVPQQAERYYEQLLQQRPDDDSVLTRLAHACLNQHQPQQALQWARQGDNPKLRALQGQLLFRLGHFAEAYEVFSTLAGEADSPGSQWLMAGYAAWNGELWSQASRALKRAATYPAQKEQAQRLLNQLDERR
ncbi:tetratricopeptide repeat protein [uncultured Desulfuromonas sp.]|uniref:tetratricopeptide repeat protein n=1 Tax=uncultured Desulfuromonas sp. TaxID=181013 RepID=UPI002AABA45E|nr:tetratricopeptide repeat protein [uncultured Desulfuromonas sp.]